MPSGISDSPAHRQGDSDESQPSDGRAGYMEERGGDSRWTSATRRAEYLRCLESTTALDDVISPQWEPDGRRARLIHRDRVGFDRHDGEYQREAERETCPK